MDMDKSNQVEPADDSADATGELPSSGEDRVEITLEIIDELLVTLGESWQRIKELEAKVEHLASIHPEPEVPLAIPTNVPQRHGVVLIEDSKIMQKRLRIIFTSLGFDVLGVAEDGESGAELVIQTNPKLLILDHLLPIMDGLACLKAIRMQCPEVRVIVCAGEPTEKMSQEYVKLGVSAIISKPIQLDRFIKEVQACMS